MKTTVRRLLGLPMTVIFEKSGTGYMAHYEGEDDVAWGKTQVEAYEQLREADKDTRSSFAKRAGITLVVFIALMLTLAWRAAR